MKPGEVYGPRINAVDMRFAKILRFGRTRTNVGIDLYNLFNANTGHDVQRELRHRWVAYLPGGDLLNPRFVRFNVTVDF